MTEAYPLHWPPGWQRTDPYKQRNDSRFKTTFSVAHRNLMNELRKLGATNVVVSSWMALTNAGLPRADQARRRIEDPGVAVYFTLRERPMVMARDGYSNVHDNLHSIGHAIAHLRGLERHGGAMMMERAFSGFAALPPPDGSPQMGTTVRHWTAILGRPENWRELAPETQRMWIDGRFKALARQLHPDNRETGDEIAFRELSEAKQAALANVGQPLP